MSDFPAALPVDDEVLDVLTQQASFAADRAYFDHIDDVSRIRNPNGSRQGLTRAEMTAVQVRAAIRNLIANGLIVTKTMEEMSEIFERGVLLD